MTTFADLIKAKKAAKAQAPATATGSSAAELQAEAERLRAVANEAEARRVAAVERRDSTAAQNTGFLQGLTFGTSEEIGSLSRNLPSWITGADPNETPQQYRDRKRAEQAFLSETQGGDYLGGEILGGVVGTAIPVAGWASGPARAAQGVSLAGRIATPIVRGATLGAVEGGLQGAGRGTGYGDRFKPAVAGAATGAVFGAAGGPLAELAGAAGGKIASATGLDKLLEVGAKKMGNTTAVAVSRNLREVARDIGMTPDEVMARVQAGQPIAGINDTTRAFARAVKNIGTGNIGTEMVETAGNRLSDTTQRVVREGQQTLVGPRRALGPALRAEAETGLSMGRDAAGEVLDQARVAAGYAVDPDTIAALEAVGPSVARNVNRALVEAGQPPLYVSNPDGPGYILARMPTVAEADMVGTGAANVATKFYQPGALNTKAAEAAEAQGKALRAAVDANYPGVAGPRRAYSEAADAERVAYPTGQEIAQTPPSKFNPFFDDLTPTGREAAKEGAAVALADMPGKSNQDTSLIDQLLGGGATGGSERYLRTNLDKLTGGEFGRQVGPTVARAKEESMLFNALTGNSTTAQQQRIMQKLDNAAAGQAITDLAIPQTALSMATRALQTAFGSQSGMTAEQIQQFGRLLMSVDPAEVQAAIKGGRRAVLDLIDRLGGGIAANRIGAGAAGAAAGNAEAQASLMDLMMGAQ